MKASGFNIENSLNEKLLGVKIDNKLAFNPHATQLCCKASQRLHNLARVRTYMDFKQGKIIMNSFIYAQFGYF